MAIATDLRAFFFYTNKSCKFDQIVHLLMTEKKNYQQFIQSM